MKLVVFVCMTMSTRLNVFLFLSYKTARGGLLDDVSILAVREMGPRTQMRIV